MKHEKHRAGFTFSLDQLEQTMKAFRVRSCRLSVGYSRTRSEAFSALGSF